MRHGFLCALLGLIASLHSESVLARCPVPGDLSWMPTAVTDGDNIIIELTVYGAIFSSFSGEVVGANINLSAITTSLIGVPPIGQVRTITIGPLPRGIYTVSLRTTWINQIPATICDPISIPLLVRGDEPSRPVDATHWAGLLILIMTFWLAVQQRSRWSK